MIENEIVGYEIDTVKYELKNASKNLSPHSSVNVIDGFSWPGEYITLYNSLAKLASIKSKGINIAVGSKFDKDTLKDLDKIIAFGDNAIKALKELDIKTISSIKGNPPDLMESIVLLKKLIDENNDDV